MNTAIPAQMAKNVDIQIQSKPCAVCIIFVFIFVFIFELVFCAYLEPVLVLNLFKCNSFKKCL